jgi:hypothetical protein
VTGKTGIVIFVIWSKRSRNIGVGFKYKPVGFVYVSHRGVGVFVAQCCASVPVIVSY